MIAPYPSPFEHEPGREFRAVGGRHLALQVLRGYPAPVGYLLGIHRRRGLGPADVDRAELMLGAVVVELSMVLELEQEFEVAADAELFRQASAGGGLHGFRAARVAA